MKMPSLGVNLRQGAPAMFALEDETWRPVNGQAEALMLECAWVKLWNGRLSFTDAASDTAFQNRVSRTLVTDLASPDARRRFPVIVRGTDGRPAGMALVFRDPNTSLLGTMGLSSPLVFAVIIQEDKRRGEQARALVEIGGLTPAEGELVSELLAGQSVREIAAGSQRSVATVRWHIRNIFTKLGISRIDDLYRIAGLVP